MSYYAITTRYHGPTDTAGSRITASLPDGRRITIPWSYENSTEDNHRAAAIALMTRYNFLREIAGGSVKHGMVWVML